MDLMKVVVKGYRAAITCFAVAVALSIYMLHAFPTSVLSYLVLLLVSGVLAFVGTRKWSS